MSAAVTAASLELVRRYDGVLRSVKPSGKAVAGCDVEHLQWMCRTMQDEGRTWPVDKLSRWLGFVQGVLVMQGVITVDEEREFSRPLFHAAYQADGRALPPSVAP